MTQTLRKPTNWQDFESLCLLLWKAEWNSEDIKKNGRNGQAQKGVDICGHKKGENAYSGIQCRCKPGNKALTTDEIDAEIENAKAFKPALKRLIFATTADKDAPTEEYVRIKDDENRKSGLFTIDIKSWDDIVLMLDLNRTVLNTFLDIVGEDYDVVVSFADGKKEAIIRPSFSRIYYTAPPPALQHQTALEEDDSAVESALSGGLAANLNNIKLTARLFQPAVATAKVVRGQVITNHSYCPLKFMMVNCGRSPIDDFKIQFSFDNLAVTFERNNVEKKMMLPQIAFSNLVSNITLKEGFGVIMFGDSLIPGDNVASDDFFVHVPMDTKEVDVTWRLLSRHYQAEGKLKIVVEKDYHDEVKYDRAKAGEIEFDDYVEEDDITD